MPHLPGETQEHADASARSGAGGARPGGRGPGEAEEGPRGASSPRLHLQRGAPGEQHRGPESQGPGAQRQDAEVPRAVRIESPRDREAERTDDKGEHRGGGQTHGRAPVDALKHAFGRGLDGQRHSPSPPPPHTPSAAT